MRKNLCLLCMALLCMLPIGCQKRDNPPREEQPQQSDSPVEPEADDSETLVGDGDMQALQQAAIRFAEEFPRVFSSPAQLEEWPGKIAWFCCWQLYYEDRLDLDERGGASIAKSDLVQMAMDRFGIRDYDPPEDLTPQFDAAEQRYDFFPIGEGSLHKAEIVGQSMQGETIVFDMLIVESDFETGAPKAEQRLSYAFALRWRNDVWFLQALSAEESPA